MSEKPKVPYGTGDEGSASMLRQFTEEPVGPLELLVMRLARDAHARAHPGMDWFGLTGSSVTMWCRRSIEDLGLDWPWVFAAIQRERMSTETEPR